MTTILSLRVPLTASSTSSRIDLTYCKKQYKIDTSSLSAALPPRRAAVFLSLRVIASTTPLKPVTVLSPSTKEYSY